jgi:hypothetical protein
MRAKAIGLLCVLHTVACAGPVPDAGAPATVGGNQGLDPGTGVAGQDQGSTGTAGSGSTWAADTPPTVAPIRRLTNVEYDNTVADLLGDTSGPASQFAADVAQDGFTNNALGQSVSPALAEQYMMAAEALSNTAAQALPTLLGCDPAIGDELTCVTQFIRSFGRRAWRRPLRAAEESRLLGVYNAGRLEFPVATAIKMVVQVMLESPQFLYLLEEPDAAQGVAAVGSVMPLDSWQVASRLSYFLIGSMPDAELFAAAELGELDSPEQIRAQAERLLESPRARERLGLFFTEWLELRNVDRMLKDATLFPDYSLQQGAMLRDQVELFATAVVLDQAGTPADLLTASYTFMTPELAPLYGVGAPTAPGFSRVDLDPSRRMGLLTHVGILANLAKSNQNDPVHRGKFVRERLLCQVVPPPPVNANITPPAVRADATTRERFAQHRADPSCAACHALMDPIGLGFEHYDALGQWRDTENNLPIDATGEIIGTDVAGTFDGAIELSHKLAQSAQVRACLVEQLFRFAHGRSPTVADDDRMSWLGGQFEAGSFQIKALLLALTQSQAFRFRLVPDPNVTAAPVPSTGEAP